MRAVAAGGPAGERWHSEGMSTLVLRPVLADIFSPRLRVSGQARQLLLIAFGTLFITVVGQVKIPLPGTPVPLTLGTFAVLLVGATLGPARGAAAVASYVALGAAGVPVFAGFGFGLGGPTTGYLLGYLPAAVLLGVAARRGWDRHAGLLVVAFAAASAVIYVGGVSWLLVLGSDLRSALMAGVVPFLVGDALKAAAVAGLLPGAWLAVRRFEERA